MSIGNSHNDTLTAMNAPGRKKIPSRLMVLWLLFQVGSPRTFFQLLVVVFALSAMRFHSVDVEVGCAGPYVAYCGGIDGCAVVETIE
jgi:hypothetical protein